MERLISPPEAARLLGIKVATLYTWVHRRQVPFQKVRRSLRFSPSALATWLEGQPSSLGKGERASNQRLA